MLVDKSLGDFIGTMVVCNFFSNNENFRISSKLLVQSFIQSFSVGNLMSESSVKALGEILDHKYEFDM